MFGFLKNLMRKPADAPAEQQDPSPADDQGYDAPEADVAPATQARGRAGAARQNGRGGTPGRGAGQAGANYGGQGQSAAQAQGRSVQIPLQPILDGLPLEIQPRVVERNVGDLSISIPLEKVLSQLARGAVKVTFGELRQLAPDVFTADVDRDRVAVPLPLSEILSRLNPALIARRRVQKQVEVPAEISSPFDPSNQGLIFNIGPSKPEKSSAASGRHVTPAAAQQKPSAPSGLPSRGAMTSAPTPPPPSMTPATPAPIAFAPRPTSDLRTPPQAPKPPQQSQTRPPFSPNAPGGTPAARPQPAPPPGFDAIPSPIRMTPKPATGQAGTPAPAVTPTPRPAAPTAPQAPRPAAPGGAHPAGPFSPTPTGAPSSRSAVNPGHSVPGQNIPSPFSLAPQQPVAPAAPSAPSGPGAAPRPAQPVQPPGANARPGAHAPHAPTPGPRPFHAAPAPQAAQTPAAPSLPTFTPVQSVATKPEDTLVVPFAALAEGWPEPIRKEAVQLGLVESKVALPADLIGQSLKLGRIAFPWQTIRSWTQGGGLPDPSPNDGIVVELPLKVVAPLFLTRQKQQKEKEQPKVSVDAEIPNLFFGFPQGDNGANAVNKPVDTNYYVWDDKEDTVHATAEDLDKPGVGTRFATKCATPNEVVSRAAALEGVAGALIALPDGLMVASRISPDLNGETLAAFLPQLFTKMTSCTKELRMGDLNNLHFTVGNTPWKIFKVNAIFFAAFGRPGEAMPTAQLSALAAELDHKPK